MDMVQGSAAVEADSIDCRDGQIRSAGKRFAGCSLPSFALHRQDPAAESPLARPIGADDPEESARIPVTPGEGDRLAVGTPLRSAVGCGGERDPPLVQSHRHSSHKAAATPKPVALEHDLASVGRVAWVGVNPGRGDSPGAKPRHSRRQHRCRCSRRASSRRRSASRRASGRGRRSWRHLREASFWAPESRSTIRTCEVPPSKLT